MLINRPKQRNLADLTEQVGYFGEFCSYGVRLKLAENQPIDPGCLQNGENSLFGRVVIKPQVLILSKLQY